MHRFLLLIFLFVGSHVLALANVKERIATLNDKLAHHCLEYQKGACYLDLAQAYLDDQEIDRAFQYYLLGIEATESKTTPEMTADEAAYVTEAMEIYIQQGSVNPNKTAQEILTQYEAIAQENAHYFQLNLLVATAYANLAQYDAFFTTFREVYPYLSEHFLSFKIQGILNMRLSQHGREFEERKDYRKKAFESLKLALNQNACDPSIYKVLIFLTKEGDNGAQIGTLLKQLACSETKVPRADVYGYVKQAVDLELIEVAEQIVERARKDYEYSRSVLAAQEYLDHH